MKGWEAVVVQWFLANGSNQYRAVLYVLCWHGNKITLISHCSLHSMNVFPPPMCMLAYLRLVCLFCRSPWRSFWRGPPLLQARRSARLSSACSPPTVSPLLLASSSSSLISFSTLSSLPYYSERLRPSSQKRCVGEKGEFSKVLTLNLNRVLQIQYF